MTKKTFTTIIFFFFLTKVSAQIEIHSSNQVGIGTTDPQHKLHVVGDAFVTGSVIGNFYFRSDSNFLGTTGNYPVIFRVNNMLSGSTGSPDNTNVSFGYESLFNSWQANTYSTAIGYRALRNVANGSSHNTTLGAYTLYSNTTGSYNTAIGSEALRSNSDGSHNIAQGHHALYSNTTGNSNVAMGSATLYNNTTGNNNTAIGHEALRSNSVGSDNIAQGQNALYSNTTGSHNTAIGNDVLYNNTTGSYNTAIGINAGTGFREIDVINNSTAIGFQAPITASNQVRIGNNTVTSIGGSVSWSNLSDGRVAKNIRNDVPGLAFINNLQPVTYNMDLEAMDELISGGKRTLAQMQIGEMLGGNRIIFDTSKNLGKSKYITSSYTIDGEDGWRIRFSYDLKNPFRYIAIQLLNPSNVVIETIYSSSTFGLNAANEVFTWEWHKSEILVPIAFGKITSMFDSSPIPGFFSVSTQWTLNDGWVAPPGSQPLDNIQQQAKENKEAQVQTGFVAQDVETAAQGVGYNFSGVDVDEKGLYGLRYSEFVVPLVKAVQELSEQNDQLREQIEELKNRIETLENR